jgi:hypothetical protein
MTKKTNTETRAKPQDASDPFFTLSDEEEDFLSTLRITGNDRLAAECAGFDGDHADELLNNPRIAITIKNEHENLGKFVRQLFGPTPAPEPVVATGNVVLFPAGK